MPVNDQCNKAKAIFCYLQFYFQSHWHRTNFHVRFTLRRFIGRRKIALVLLILRKQCSRLKNATNLVSLMKPYDCLAVFTVWLFGCWTVWLFGCLAVWLFGCFTVWLFGCFTVWLFEVYFNFKCSCILRAVQMDPHWIETAAAAALPAATALPAALQAAAALTALVAASGLAASLTSSTGSISC